MTALTKAPPRASLLRPLFAADNTLMDFADGRQALVELISEIKEVRRRIDRLPPRVTV